MIILGVMVIVIIFGAYQYFSSKKKAQPDTTAQKTAELNTFVASLSADLGKGGATTASDAIYLHAAKKWTQDPFVDSSVYNAWAKVSAAAAKGGTAEVSKKAEFAYNGYLIAGKQKIAVINGMEYKEGEALDIRGFVLKSISPEWVVIENRGTRAMLNIPLQD